MKSLTVKRNEANQRKAARAKRSNGQQIALLRKRPGESKREMARLTA